MLEEESKKPEEEQVDKAVISKFLSKYTRNVVYKECLQSGSARINLQGEEVDKVTSEHAEFAKKSLEDWRNKQAANKKNNKGKPRK
jgi:sRNA-binding protein